MKHKVLLVTLFFSIFITSTGLSITLEEALKEAVSQSDELKIAEHGAEEVIAQANELTAFTLPQITIEGGHGFMGTDRVNPIEPLLEKIGGEGIDGINEIPPFRTYLDNLDEAAEESYKYFELSDNQSLVTVKLDQVLFAGGNIWKTWKLKAKIETQAEKAVHLKRNEIRKQVKTAFQKVLLLNSNLKILKDRVSQREEELNDARDLLNAGLVTSLDLRHAKLKINFALDDLKAGEVEFKNALIDFNKILGRSENKPLLMPKGILDRGWKLSEKIKELRKRHSDNTLLAVESQHLIKEVASLNAKIANGKYFPKILLSSKNDYIINDNEDYFSWNAGLMLSWNLFSGGAKKYQKASALAARNKADSELRKTRKDIANLIKQISEQAKVLGYRIDVQQETVSLAAENYNDARSQYRAGTITQTQMNEFDLAYSEVRFKLQSLYFMERELEIQVEALLE